MQNTMTNFELSADTMHHIWQNGYSRVPNSILERKDLSAMAKICIAWLIGRPSGWHLVISQMCSALNISERQWSTAKKELITVGLFEQKKLKKPDGKYEWHHWWLTIPTLFKDGQAANDETMNAEPMDLALQAKNKDKALHPTNMQDGESHYLSVAASDCGVFNIPNAMARKWQDAGIKIEQVQAACGKAQKQKGNKTIPANYLDRIVMDYANKTTSSSRKSQTLQPSQHDETMQHRPKLAQSFIASAVSKMTAENSTYDPVKTAEEFRKLGIKTQPPTLRDSPPSH